MCANKITVDREDEIRKEGVAVMNVVQREGVSRNMLLLEILAYDKLG